MAGQAAACWGSCLLLLLSSCEAARPMQVIKSWASIVTEDGLVSINLSLIRTAYFSLLRRHCLWATRVPNMWATTVVPHREKGDTSAAQIAVGEFLTSLVISAITSSLISQCGTLVVTSTGIAVNINCYYFFHIYHMGFKSHLDNCRHFFGNSVPYLAHGSGD